MSGLAANFAGSTPSMTASLTGELVFGVAGEPGGYYSIHISQPDASTMRIGFLPSKSTMPSISSVNVLLPKGPKGDPGQADEAQVQELVMEYLRSNPPKVTETDPTVPAWAKEKTKPAYTAAEVGAVSADALEDAIGDALAQAKESGAFDGKTPALSIGTVETLESGSHATASITGTVANPVLNLGIPRGEAGSGGGSDGSQDVWELLNTITVSDDATTSVTFSADSNGNAFALKKLLLKITGIKGASTYSVLRLNNLIWMEQFGGATYGATANINTNISFEILSSGVYLWENSNPHGRDIRIDGQKTSNGRTQSHIETVNSVQWLWATGSALTNGTVFTLYGVRV